MQSVPITTDVCKFETRSGLGVQHDVMKFVSDLRQIGGFLQLKLNVRCRNGRIVVGFHSTYSRHSYLHLIWATTIRAFGLWCDVLDSGSKPLWWGNG
jgi:hypothetical protein